MIDITQEQIMKNWSVENNYTPLVSVKCMTFNHENYIAQALDSFLMQKTTFPFEILVHDDASSDKTAEIVREYESKFPKIVKGIYESENQWSKGNKAHHVKIDAAIKGKYIAFCEGDDYWIDERKLQTQADFLEKNPEYGMCYTNFNIYYQRTGKMERDLFNTKPEKFQAEYTLEQWIYRAGYIAPMSWLYRKEMVDYIPKIKTLDGSFVMVAGFMHAAKVKCFRNSTTCVYRVLDESASHSKNIKNIYLRNKSLCETQIELIKLFLLSDKIIQKCLQSYYHSSFKLWISFENKASRETIFNNIQNKKVIEKILFCLTNNRFGQLIFRYVYSLYWKSFGSRRYW